MTRTSGHPKWLRSAETVDLEPIALSSSLSGARSTDEAPGGISESWLQEQLDQHPDLLPIDEIGPSWGPVISLGREIPLVVGAVDNMFVSPTGELTVVETKLWRNPEARRKVVGQILDYAAALKRLSYEELDELVDELEPSRGGIWHRICQSAFAPDAATEGTFIDAVGRNLARGSFLLLIVGDGIREDLDGIADLLREHSSLRFHLELVEMRLFGPQGGQGGNEILIVPSIVGRTREVVRSVIEIRQPHAGDVDVTVVTPEPDDDGGGEGSMPRLRSLDEYVERASGSMPSTSAEAIAELARWWQAKGGQIRLNRRSINFAARYSATTANLVSVMTVYLNGRAQGSVDPLTVWKDVIDAEATAERFHAAGFSGDPQWPTRVIDPARDDQRASLTDLLSWIFDRVAEAEARLYEA